MEIDLRSATPLPTAAWPHRLPLTARRRRLFHQCPIILRKKTTDRSPLTALPPNRLTDLVAPSAPGYNYRPPRHHPKLKPQLTIFMWLAASVFVVFGSFFLIVNVWGWIDHTQDQVWTGVRELKAAAKTWQKTTQSDPELFSKARARFYQAQQSTLDFSQYAQGIFNDDTALAAVNSALRLGQNLSQMGETYATLWQELKTYLTAYQNDFPALPAPTSLLKMMAPRWQETWTQGQNALAAAQELQKFAFSPELSNQLNQIIDLLNDHQRWLQLYQLYSPNLLEALGDRTPRRYLILLQNSSEMRATGGFIGSVIEVTLNQGRLSDWHFVDVYDIDGHRSSQEPSPAGLEMLTKDLHFRDANYDPDFPASARRLIKLYEASGHATIDGVIALNDVFFSDLLTVLGPLETPRLPVALTAENAAWLISYYVEAKFNQAHPKELLKELTPLLFTRLSQHPQALVYALSRAITHKNIAFYSPWASLNRLNDFAALDHPLAPATADYLLVVNTSIGGNKSDRYLTEHYQHATHLYPDHLENTLTIDKEHTFGAAAEKQLEEQLNSLQMKKDQQVVKDEKILHLLGKGDNVSFMRVYIPRTAVFDSLSGADSNSLTITEEGDKKVLGFVVRTHTGQSQKVILKYRLPYTDQTYHLHVDKQLGAPDITFDKTVTVTGGHLVDQNIPSTNRLSTDRDYRYLVTD